MKKTLCDLKENESAKILDLEGENFAIERRLFELGFLPGREIKILEKSFSKKTILIEIENYTIALRCSVANYIKVA